MWLLLPFLITSLIITCFLLIVVVLMQRPKSEGLGAAFGSGMTDNLFGTQTTNVLSRMTVWLGGLFFLLTLLISIVYVKTSSGPTAIQQQLLQSVKKESAKKEVLPEALPSATPIVDAPAVATSPAISASPAPSAASIATPPAGQAKTAAADQ